MPYLLDRYVTQLHVCYIVTKVDVKMRISEIATIFSEIAGQLFQTMLQAKTTQLTAIQQLHELKVNSLLIHKYQL